MNNTQSLFHLLLVLVFFFITQFPVLSRSCHDNERSALLSFKSSLSDPSNRLLSWQQESRNCCAWHGIQCAADSFHVVALDLRNTNLEIYIRNYISDNRPYPSISINGTISPSLFNLIHLQYLDLSWNDFEYSEIPQGFANLKKLTHLDLSNSYFEGSITTQFANLSSLSYLDVSCAFEFNRSYLLRLSFGALETSTNWLRGLVNLKVLKLSGVDLSSSANKNWAEPISYLSDLRELDLSKCGISGSFPFNEFLNLSHLSSLKLNSNYDLDPSSIPVQLANLTSLSVLGLFACNLEGSIPYLPQLEELYVGDNPDLKVNFTWMIEHWHKLNTLYISRTHVIPSILSSNLNTSSSSSLVNLFAKYCSIQGSFPTSITKLSQLEVLVLSGNKFQGSIPETICEVSSLHKLSLDDNNLTGRIPSCITKLRNLSTFEIAYNSVEGNVSLVSYINELNLTILSLRSNSITVEIDQHLSPSKFHLKRLELQSCNMKGYIPTFICNFTQLKKLDLSHNNLIGDIPFCLFRLPNLNYLDLSVNKLQGTLPRSLPYLSKVNLSSNNLEGLLPLQSQNFYSFDLSHNSFTGFSIEAGKRLFNAAFVYLSGNKLSGSIPFSLCSSKNERDKDSGSLYSLDLSNNSLTGTIPSSLSYCDGLGSLNLGMNNLTGNVPNELGRLIYLQYLQLNDNSLNGTFPDFIGKLQGLKVLNLANNNFGGNIPTLIGSLHELKILSLRSNTFSGSIPKEINGLHQLQIFDLSSNHFSGPIPHEISDLKMLISRPDDRSRFADDNLYMLDTHFQMVVKGIMIQFDRLYKYNSGIDLSCNNLGGSIPEDIGLLKELVMLNLSHNSLSGHIPKSLGKVIGLQSLDLSFNKLSGDIPQSLESMSGLGYFNLSYNNFSGRIPEGRHLDTLSGENGSAYFGNYWLCGLPTNKSCPGDDMVKKGEDDEDVEDEDASEKWLLCGIVFLGFGVGFWGLFLVLLIKKEKWWFGYWRVVNNIAVRIAECIR